MGSTNERAYKSKNTTKIMKNMKKRVKNQRRSKGEERKEDE